MPVLIAPTAFHRLAHPEGEVATARAAAEAGTIMVVSMAATRPVEEIAAAGGPLWFQLYPQPDLDFTASVVRRAEAAGCTRPGRHRRLARVRPAANATCGTASPTCRPG